MDNTNSQTGSSNSTDLNASGLLVYEVSNAVTIDGTHIQGYVPEVGTWLPIVGALGLFGWFRWRRRANAVSAV